MQQQEVLHELKLHAPNSAAQVCKEWAVQLRFASGKMDQSWSKNEQGKLVVEWTCTAAYEKFTATGATFHVNPAMKSRNMDALHIDFRALLFRGNGKHLWQRLSKCC